MSQTKLKAKPSHSDRNVLAFSSNRAIDKSEQRIQGKSTALGTSAKRESTSVTPFEIVSFVGGRNQAA